MRYTTGTVRVSRKMNGYHAIILLTAIYDSKTGRQSRHGYWKPERAEAIAAYLNRRKVREGRSDDTGGDNPNQGASKCTTH